MLGAEAVYFDIGVSVEPAVLPVGVASWKNGDRRIGIAAYELAAQRSRFRIIDDEIGVGDKCAAVCANDSRQFRF